MLEQAIVDYIEYYNNKTIKVKLKPSYVQEALYQELRDLSRFYQNLTEDIVCAKNRLHKVLQVTFPELENILSAPTGEQYWNLVITFPCNSFVLESDDATLTAIIR